ncbi:tyrosine-protein phosphatase [Rhodococcus maanshanensis]|uniref:Protein-tyrosine phosphatase n=1 Tax=Rhodococcus maanshanensis TaxID=183556 RepID=A0A1H7KKU0_9NOCA|nr:tyrosine-protein phosphatase [Rhodococcus maanshanensis]SEK87473.1 protein-tyrosine phosphatase [Rhodococcus maanshanensis]
MSRRVTRVATLLVTSSVLFMGSAGLAAAEPVLPPALAGLLESGSAGLGSSAPVADAPRLASVDNFRDVAGIGTGYAAAHDRHVAKGVFFRSNAIAPHDADRATLAGLGLTVAYDLRSAGEIAKKQDRLPDGVAYMNIPILSGNVNEAEIVANIHTPEDARELMRTGNRAFVTGEVERAGFGKLLTELANTDGPQVFHCTAGKDRTGWASYLLLSIAGVAQGTIMDDYLLTNEYAKDSIAATLAHIEQGQGPEMAAKIAPLIGVEQSYLQAGIDQLVTSYGTVENYLTSGLGLSADTVTTLRHKLIG